jgi:hypothetical protein
MYYPGETQSQCFNQDLYLGYNITGFLNWQNFAKKKISKFKENKKRKKKKSPDFMYLVFIM